jgi:hypothetical protein
VTPDPESRKKRVRPARKIVPRANMGPLWVTGSIVLAAVIAIAGAILLLTRPG